MIHSVSPRKQRERTLASPVEDWRERMLVIDCGGPRCTRGRHYLMADLACV